MVRLFDMRSCRRLSQFVMQRAVCDRSLGGACAAQNTINVIPNSMSSAPIGLSLPVSGISNSGPSSQLRRSGVREPVIAVTSLAFSAGGRWVYAGCDDYQVRVWYAW